MKKIRPDKRSRGVFECWVCGALTNRISSGEGSAGSRTGTVCPQSHLKWHHFLQKKVELLFQPHPKSYLEELADEIRILRQKYKSKIKNDLAGKYDLAKRSEISYVRSSKGYKVPKVSEHFAFRKEGLRLLRNRSAR